MATHRPLSQRPPSRTKSAQILPLLIGIVLSVAVFAVSSWAALSLTPAQLDWVRSHLFECLLGAGLSGSWLVALALYGGQQIERHHPVTAPNLGSQQAMGILEQELLRSQTLLHASRDGIVTLDAQGDVITANPKFAAMLGYSLAETLTLNVADWDAQWSREELKAIREDTQFPPLFETRHRRQDGSIYDVEISYSQLVLDGERLHFCICRDISDRKRLESARQQTEQALRQSETRFQAFMNHSPAPAWITDADGLVLYASETYTSTFQVPTADLVGKSIFELFPVEIAAPFLANIQAVAHTQTVLEQVEVAPRPDGTLGDFLVYKFPIPDESGQRLVGGVAVDITRQRQAEEALRQSQLTKQAIIEAIPDLLLRMSADGTYLDLIANPSHSRPSFDPIRQAAHLRHTVSPDRVQQRLHHARQALATGAPQLYEQETFVQGRHRYEEVRVVPLRTAEVLIMVRDITDRKWAEKALRDQKEMLQAIVNHIPAMVALFNSSHQVEFVNPELERVLGWSLTEWQEQDVLAQCYPDPAYRQQVFDHMAHATGQWHDITTLNARGQTVETSWANVPLSNGLSLGIGQDISDRKRRELALQEAMEAAEAANLAKSAFLANMSHELRTPLNVILGFSQVIAHAPNLTTEQRQDLQTIRRSGDHLLSLINEVLDLSKIEAGHCVVELTSFDLIALLHMLRTMLAERASTKGLTLDLEIAPEVPQFILADAPKLRQVLLNLLGNAIKFTYQGGVTLRVGMADPTPDESRRPQGSPATAPPPAFLLTFAVQDTGIGIASQDIETLFDAFIQAQAGKRSAQGTGLGLTISHKLVELMGGTLSVQSRPGEGSTFSLTLGVHSTDRPASLSEPPESRVIEVDPKHRHYRILVVDDQPENRLLLVRILRRIGLTVREACSGEEAISLWQSWQPNLTWMDICMTGIDGYETTRQIRALEAAAATAESRSTPSVIIALTAQASHSDRNLALAAGCTDYVSKPLQEGTLFIKMKEHLGLDYLYGEPVSLAMLTLQDHGSTQRTNPPLLDLTRLPLPWVTALEEAAICGSDGAIAELAQQLPSDHVTLARYLTELASQYQFEQILQLLPINVLG